MIKKYVYGKPIETDAVLSDVVTQLENDKLPFFDLNLEDGFKITYDMEHQDIIYGLGETVRGINKRGWIYESRCQDNSKHTETQRSLYAAHNFFMVVGKETFGVFVDFSGIVSFDLGYTNIDKLIVHAATADLKLYIITPDNESKNSQELESVIAATKNHDSYNDITWSGSEHIDISQENGDKNTALNSNNFNESHNLRKVSDKYNSKMLDIVRQFRAMIGRSYIAPLWAFGYQQSRYSYMDTNEIREVVKKHKKFGLPLDSIYLDIDYMERYKDFTYDKKRFGDLPELIKELKSDNLHLVPIIDAAVKIEKGYSVYDEGVEKGYFCKNEDGTDFVAGVWPGKVHFPDVLNPEARKWFGYQYKSLLDLGVDGFWNDMNEPAIFYSQENLDHVFKRMEELKGSNIDIKSYFEIVSMVMGMLNNQEDYKRFYHKINGKMVRHDKVHNLYGYNMTRAAKEAFDKIREGERTLLFSRSSYIGMHRYGGLWSGDNHSWWSHLKLILQQLPSLNMCGFLYTGADVGGFQADTTEDLVIRWLSFSLFTPLMRNHSADDTRHQELYLYENIDIIRNLLRLRYAMVPYLYSEYMKSALNNDMLYRPLSFDYPDDLQTYQIEDQLLFGESLMLAPIYNQNSMGRYVYLPEDMMLVRVHYDNSNIVSDSVAVDKESDNIEKLSVSKLLHSDMDLSVSERLDKNDSIDLPYSELVDKNDSNRKKIQYGGLSYETKILPKGHHYIKVPMTDVIFFIRPDKMMVIGKGVKNTSDIKIEDLKTLGYIKTHSEYKLYFDDGISKDYTKPSNIKTYTL